MQNGQKVQLGLGARLRKNDTKRLPKIFSLILWILNYWNLPLVWERELSSSSEMVMRCVHTDLCALLSFPPAVSFACCHCSKCSQLPSFVQFPRAHLLFLQLELKTSLCHHVDQLLGVYWKVTALSTVNNKEETHMKKAIPSYWDRQDQLLFGGALGADSIQLITF